MRNSRIFICITVIDLKLAFSTFEVQWFTVEGFAFCDIINAPLSHKQFSFYVEISHELTNDTRNDAKFLTGIIKQLSWDFSMKQELQFQKKIRAWLSSHMLCSSSSNSIYFGVHLVFRFATLLYLSVIV